MHFSFEYQASCLTTGFDLWMTQDEMTTFQLCIRSCIPQVNTTIRYPFLELEIIGFTIFPFNEQP